MFKDKVNSTSFTTTAADRYFSSKISGVIGMHNGDYYDTTLCATIRALFEPRMRDGDFIQTMMESITMYGEEIKRIGEKRAASKMFYDFGCGGSLTSGSIRSGRCGDTLLFVDVKGNKNDIEMMFDTIEHYFTNKEWNEVSGSLHKLEKVSQFFVKSFKCLCYIDERNRNTVYFIENMNLQKFHIMQATVLPALPWYFDSSQGITDDERALLLSLQGKDSTAYIDAIEKLAQKYDFESAFINETIDGFSRFTSRSRLTYLNNRKSDLDRQIRALNQELANFVQELQHTKNELTGLSLSINDTSVSDAVVEYFKSNKNIVLVDGNVDTGELSFIYKTYINSWESSQTAERVVEDTRSELYAASRSSASMFNKNEMQMVYKALFIDRSIKLRSIAAFKISSTRFSQPAISNYVYPVCYDTYYPNPHLQYHSCMSAWTQGMADAFSEGDYIFPITACGCAAGNLSLNDVTVMKEMSNDLFINKVKEKYFELPNGKLANMIDVVQYLKGEQGNE